MRHWVYALVLGILLGLGLGVGGTLLWHSERKQAPPPVTPAVVALFNNSGKEEFYFALINRSVRLVDRDLLQNSLRLREAERKDESRMTRYRKVSQEFGAKLLVIIENTGQGPKFIGDRETHHNKDYAQIFEVDSGVLLRAWDNTNNDWPAKPAPVAEAVKTLAERLGVTRP
jgi:hypothetical protein